jgi:hypothetical protein
MTPTEIIAEMERWAVAYDGIPSAFALIEHMREWFKGQQIKCRYCNFMVDQDPKHPGWEAPHTCPAYQLHKTLFG